MAHHQEGNNLHGFYSSFKKWIPRAVVEPYAFWRTDPNDGAKVGPKGHLNEWTYGARLAGKFTPGLLHRFDYNAEAAAQRGTLSKDTIDAWFGHAALGYALYQGDKPVRLVVEYNYASGDPNSSSSEIGTFDQLYPSNHNKFGYDDYFGLKNIKNAVARAEWKPARKWTVTEQVADDRLATVGDSVYNNAGTALFHNYKAASDHLGEEADIYAMYTVSPTFTIGAIYGHLFRGAYLVELAKGSTSTGGFTFTYRF
jgi:hypothetical protein